MHSRRRSVIEYMTILSAVFLMSSCGGGSDTAVSPTAPLDTGQQQCLARAVFGEPADSVYVLPYPVGSAFVVTQSYCNPTGGHADTFAYDFGMPLGAPITAIRDGEVARINDQFADDDHASGHENNVFIRHADGTVVRYTHLQQDSIIVAPGDLVTAGQRLGSNGASGNSGGFPHLHLEIFNNSTLAKSNTVPINFRNAGGAHDARGGLAAGTAYAALPY